MASNVERYAHLIETDWDRQFLLNPAFTGWFNTQMSTNPIGPDEPLVDYVRARIAGQREGNGNGAPAPVAVAVQTEDVEEEAEEQTPEPNSAPLVTKADDDLDFFDMTSYAPDEASSSEHIDVGDTPSYGNSPPAAVVAPTIEEDEPSPFHSYSTTTTAAHLHHSSLLNHASSTINDTSTATATSSTSTSSAHYDSSASINPSSMVDGSSINPSTISEPAPAPRKTEGEEESESLKVQRQLVKQEQKRVAEQEAQGQPASKKRVAAAVVKSAPKPAVVQKKVVPVSRLGTKASKPAQAPAPAAVSVGSSDDDEPPSASESWSKILPTLRESLTATRFTRATTSTVSKIVKILLEFQLPASGEEVGDWGDGSQVPPEGRGEVLDALLRFGGEEGGEVWKAMLGPGGEGSLEVLQSWLVGGAMSLLAGKKEERAKGREAQGTLGRVLKVISRLSLTLDHLRKYKKIAGRVKKVSGKAVDAEVKKLATTLTDRWSQMQDAEAKAKMKGSAATSTSTSGAADKGKAAVKKELDPKAKGKEKEKEEEGKGKRKAVAEEDSKKKVKTATAAAAASKPVGPLFGAKPPLPSFKKATPTTTTTSTLSPFQQALQAMNSKKKAPVAPAEGAGAAGARLGKSGKKLKTVRWKPDEELVKFKMIESRSEGFESAIGDQENAKLMEGEEGDVLKSHLDEDMDEEIDWYDPIPLVIPPDAQQGGPTSDAANCETIRQAMSDAMDLDEELESPVEPADPYTQPSADPTPMSLSPELRDDDSVQSSIAHAQASTTPLGGWAANDEIQNLLGQITAGSLGAPQQQQQQHYNPYTSSYSQHPPPQQPPALDQSALSALAGFDTQLVRGIIQQNPQLASLGPQLDQLGVFGAPPPTTNGGNGDPYTPSQYGYDPYGRLPPPPAGYGQGPPPSNDSAWNNHGPAPPPQLKQGNRPGTVKSRKRIKVACRFFSSAKGCEKGDACPFVHDRYGRGDSRG